MKQYLCAGCRQTSVVRGYLFDNVRLGFCGQCRDLTLSYLKFIGMPLDNRNWLIDELTYGTHYLESAWFHFYNSVTKEGDHVLDLAKRSRMTPQQKAKIALDIDD